MPSYNEWFIGSTHMQFVTNKLCNHWIQPWRCTKKIIDYHRSRNTVNLSLWCHCKMANYTETRKSDLRELACILVNANFSVSRHILYSKWFETSNEHRVTRKTHVWLQLTLQKILPTLRCGISVQPRFHSATQLSHWIYHITEYAKRLAVSN